MIGLYTVYPMDYADATVEAVKPLLPSGCWAEEDGMKDVKGSNLLCGDVLFPVVVVVVVAVGCMNCMT